MIALLKEYFNCFA
jgi:hypothetical protein